MILAAALLAGCASSLERELVAVNEAAKIGPGNCVDHVQRVRQALAGRYVVRTFRTRTSRWYATNHVSAAVETAEGLYILDNGALQQRRDVTRLVELVRWWRFEELSE